MAGAKHMYGRAKHMYGIKAVETGKEHPINVCSYALSACMTLSMATIYSARAVVTHWPVQLRAQGQQASY